MEMFVNIIQKQINQNLKDNIYMEKEMEKEKNIMIVRN